MAFLTITTPQLNKLRTEIQAVRKSWAKTVQAVLDEKAQQGVYRLQTTAPQGKGDPALAPPGDAPGSLALSFTAESGGNPGTTIRTSQPTKLKFVRYGTGLYGPLGHRIYPITKRFLYWQGATHPVRSVAGQKPNDFVTPVIESTLQELDQAARQTTRDMLTGVLQ